MDINGKNALSIRLASWWKSFYIWLTLESILPALSSKPLNRVPNNPPIPPKTVSETGTLVSFVYIFPFWLIFSWHIINWSSSGSVWHDLLVEYEEWCYVNWILFCGITVLFCSLFVEDDASLLLLSPKNQPIMYI